MRLSIRVGIPPNVRENRASKVSTVAVLLPHLQIDGLGSGGSGICRRDLHLDLGR